VTLHILSHNFIHYPAASNMNEWNIPKRTEIIDVGLSQNV